MNAEVTAEILVERSVTGRKWCRRPAPARVVQTLIDRHGLDPILAEVLAGRGITPEIVDAHLTPTLRNQLPDPSCLTDMDGAAARIADAIRAGEPIGIFGDYDVDGTTSSALLYRYFSALGHPAHVHLPDRLTEGYGPNLDAFRDLREKGAQLTITVDCGATAHTVLAEAAAEGIDVIVLDHHGMTLPPPPAVAVVNPNRPDCASGLHDLSAGGVVFLTLIAVNRALRNAGYFEKQKEPNLLQWLDLVALSLVCDVMPLRGLTRTFVRQGLARIGEWGQGGGNLGIRLLAEAGGAKNPPQASHFGFTVGPRINAAGRIGHAQLAFDLLTTDDAVKAAALVERLGELNGLRQGVEKAVLEDATTQARQKGGREAATPLVVWGEGWHPGVIGIVAGRLKDRFQRPAIVLAFDGEEGKGSARSLPGADMGAAIADAAEAGLILGGGGHPMAAGLSLTRAQLPGFEAFLAEALAEGTATARADITLWLDGKAGTGAVSRPFAEEVMRAGPYGQGNPEPRFMLPRVVIEDARIVGESHLSITVRDGMGKAARGIAFGVVDEPLGDALLAARRSRSPVHLAGRIKTDDWRGGDAGQIQIEDAAMADEVTA